MEKFYRKKEISKGEPIIFQAIEWLESNEKKETEMDEDVYSAPKYTIRIFGVTSTRHSITITVENFTPFFYIKVPSKFEDKHIKELIRELKSKVDFQYRSALVDKQVRIMLKKDIYGYKGDNKYEKFIRLVFNNSWAMRKYKNVLDSPIFLSSIHSSSMKLPQYESNLDTFLKFIHIKDVEPTGWIKIEKYRKTKHSKTQLDVVVEWLDIQKVEDRTTNAEILQASYDIETYSAPLLDELTNKKYYPFPQATIDSNEIYQIATCFKKVSSTNTEFYVKTLLTLKKYYAEGGNTDKERKEDEKNGIYVVECKTEEELLLQWATLIQNMDPDILYQYNGDQFDCKYIYTRVKRLGLEIIFNKTLSRLYKVPCSLKKSTFSSGAYGTSEFERLIIPGRINFDILVYIKKEYKETSYKLDDIAEKYLKENKLDVTPVDIFKAYENGTSESIKQIGLYCIQDTLLPQKLVDKLSILQSLISMSNVTYVTIKMLIERGQQIKAYSQIVRAARKKQFLFPTLDYNRESPEGEDEKFQGATVLKATPGFYYDSPITVLDFASLYPSIIIAHNLCYSSFINETDQKKIDKIKEELDVKTVEWEETHQDELKRSIVKKYSYNFVQTANTVLPDLLNDLALQRKKYKKLMGEATEPFQKEIYNKTQLAYKLSMNSCYGVLGAKMIGCKPIAATVTALGREMIQQTLEYVETNFKAEGQNEVIYGDSVTKNTIVILRNKKTGMIEIKEIGSIVGDWEAYNEFKAIDTRLSNRRHKQQCYLDCEVWSDIGWTYVSRFIRHKCNKSIYKITTNSGSVCVTQDHSLLTPSMNKVKPDCVFIGDKLLHVESYPCTDDLDIDSLEYIYLSKMTINKEDRNHEDVIKIEALGSIVDEYVYDIETSIGRYAAGFGGIVVKNTDSVFVKFNTEKSLKMKELEGGDEYTKKECRDECIQEAFELGNKAAKEISKALFKAPIKLEFEKVYYPMLLLSKKRYIANFYETNAIKPDKLEMKGVVLKRRDNCELLKTCYKGMIDPIMEHQKEGITIAIEFIKDKIQELIDNRIDLNQLVITKTLRTGYKNQNIPHLVLARKMAARDPGNAPAPNDRVSYVYVETKDKKAKQYEKVEDPAYVKENNLKIDVLYYIEHQLEIPIIQVLSLVTDNPERIFKEIKRNYTNSRDGQTTLLSWLKPTPK